MTHEKFMEKSKLLVADVTGMEVEDVYVVWSVKAADNSKALMGARNSGSYFEITLHGSKNAIYLDKYIQDSHTTIEIK